MAVDIPMMPLELQVANVSNIITFTLGILCLYYAMKEFGNPVSLKYFKVMALGILLYSLLHEGMDIVTGTVIQNHMPEWIYGFWTVLVLQNVGPVVFVTGAILYSREMFKTLKGD